MGIHSIQRTRSQYQKSKSRNLPDRVADLRFVGADVDQCFCIHGYGEDDLLLRSRSADLECQSCEDCKDFCVA